MLLQNRLVTQEENGIKSIVFLSSFIFFLCFVDQLVFLFTTCRMSSVVNIIKDVSVTLYLKVQFSLISNNELLCLPQ